METVILVGEQQIKCWIKEIVSQVLKEMPQEKSVAPFSSDEESFLSRKNAAAKLGISLVTLNAWIKRGLPAHKNGKRVLLLYSEIRSFMLMKGGKL